MSEDVRTIFKKLKQITEHRNRCFQFNWQIIANNPWEIFQMSVGSKLMGLIALEEESNYLIKILLKLLWPFATINPLLKHLIYQLAFR